MDRDISLKETIGKRMRTLRTAKKLTVKEVAAQLRVPMTTYREWENGRAIQGEPYMKIAEVFEIGLSELMTGEVLQFSELTQQCEEIIMMTANLKQKLISHLSADRGLDVPIKPINKRGIK